MDLGRGTEGREGSSRRNLIYSEKMWVEGLFGELEDVIKILICLSLQVQAFHFDCSGSQNISSPVSLSHLLHKHRSNLHILEQLLFTFSLTEASQLHQRITESVYHAPMDSSNASR